MDKNKAVLFSPKFIYRIIRSILLALFFIMASLFFGMWGYHHFENLNWLDSYVNAAMILSGMGPLAAPKTDAGKLFEGTYALFSGIIFLVSVGLILAPLFHHFFHKLHVDETPETVRRRIPKNQKPTNPH